MPSGTRTAVLLLTLAAVVFAVATAGMLQGREPFATWYYQFAWYALLVAADALLRLRTGRFFLLRRPARAAALFAWSIPFWVFFELLNFRMANWYYVFLPRDRLVRWMGISIAFATVLPAILISERMLAAAGVGRVGIDGPRVGRCVSFALQGIGAGMVALALTWPRLFYPLIWGSVTLLLDPWVYRRTPGRSLLGRASSAAAPPAEPAPGRRGRRAILFSAAVLRGMERFTISSYTPRTADLPGVPTAPLVTAGYDPFELARAEPADVARRAGLDLEAAGRAVERARLVTLRGLGTENARALAKIGIGSVEALAELPAEAVADRLRVAGDRPSPARIRVWVRAAQRKSG